MQERRTLFYMDLDDIPSSAVEVTNSNYSSLLGNVLYVPIGNTDTYYNTNDDGYISNNRTYISIDKTNCTGFYIFNNIAKTSWDSSLINKITLGLECNDKNVTSLAYKLGNNNTNYIRLTPVWVSKYSPVGGYNVPRASTTYTIPGKYFKITFIGTIKLNSALTGVTYPIYIDTE